MKLAKVCDGICAWRFLLLFLRDLDPVFKIQDIGDCSRQCGFCYFDTIETRTRSYK